MFKWLLGSSEKEVGVRISMPLHRFVPLKVIPGFTKTAATSAECIEITQQDRKNIENTVRNLCNDRGCRIGNGPLVEFVHDRQGSCSYNEMKIHEDGDAYYIIVDWASWVNVNELLARFYDDADRDLIRRRIEEERRLNEEGEMMYRLERKARGPPRKTRVFNTATNTSYEKFNEANFNTNSYNSNNNIYGGRRSTNKKLKSRLRRRAATRKTK
jgi:hypothetical protein